MSLDRIRRALTTRRDHVRVPHPGSPNRGPDRPVQNPSHDAVIGRRRWQSDLRADPAQPIPPLASQPPLESEPMPLLEREDCLLLVIDAQERFYPTTRDDVDFDRLHDTFDRSGWLVAVASAVGVPIVVTEEEANINGATDARIASHLPHGRQYSTRSTSVRQRTPRS